VKRTSYEASELDLHLNHFLIQTRTDTIYVDCAVDMYL